MADKQSREVVEIEKNHGGEEWGIFAVTAEGKRYAISEAEYSRLHNEIIKNSKPELDFRQVLYQAYSDGTPVVEAIEAKEDTDLSVVSVKVDLDVSDAIKGLKAVQREARKTTAALKELEEQQNKTEINGGNLYRSGNVKFNTESGELSIEGGTFKLGTSGVPWSWSRTDKKD